MLITPLPYDLPALIYHFKKKEEIFRHAKTLLAESGCQSQILKETMGTKDQEEQRESSQPTQSLQKKPRLYASCN
ncbi:hypothetical protein Hamer_G015437 [Homarus americanus]|uniref:Uncharacterized protein n=1 Tax=Homarus americanus TaxID=6706 RepID=A0A8J5N9W5_HOMAM|nr:hypothetical protein Hamer_G015437 [Homarus americanus]